MAKKASKIVLNPKAAKATDDVEVANTPTVKVEQVDAATLESIAIDPISDDELSVLIEDGQGRYQELLEKEPWTATVIMTPELALALLTRNKSNRFANPKVVDQYCERFLTNRMDEQGEYETGTILWEQGLPAQVIISDEGNLHNSQKCLLSYLKALSLFDLNQEEAADPKKDKSNFEDYAVDRGLTRDKIANALTVTIYQGMPESAADYVDTAQQRTNADLSFRRHLFDRFDYRGMFKSIARKQGESDESLVHRRDAKLATYYQEQSKLHATVLSFVARRLWDNGKLPRQQPSYGSVFTQDMFNEANSAFPNVVDSVHYIWKNILKGSDKKRITGITGLGLSPQYLATAHYLASMHDAVWSDKHGWQQTEEGRADADNFIALLTSPKEGKSKHPQLTQQVVNWQEAVIALNKESKSDSVLNGLANSMAYVWRLWKFTKEDGYVKGESLKNTLDPSAQYCPYSEDDTNESSFDRAKLSGDEADVAAAKIAAKVEMPKETAKKKPPMIKTKA